MQPRIFVIAPLNLILRNLPSVNHSIRESQQLTSPIGFQSVNHRLVLYYEQLDTC